MCEKTNGNAAMLASCARASASTGTPAIQALIGLPLVWMISMALTLSVKITVIPVLGEPERERVRRASLASGTQERHAERYDPWVPDHRVADIKSATLVRD